MFLVYTVLIAVCLLMGATVGIYLYTFFSYRKMRDCYDLPQSERYRGAEKMRVLISELEQRPISEEITITALDGTKLYGRYYHVRDGAPIHIEMHGYKGTAYRDFCGGNKLAKEMGHNSLLIDQRAHGKSGGRTITFGEKEKYDCKSWAEYLYRRFPDSSVLLVGVSMGGATVLAAGELELPPNVKGIVADCPYSAGGSIIREVCAQKGVPAAPVYPLIFLAALMFGRFVLSDRTLGNTRLPVCIIHGEEDTFVPARMSQEIVEKYPYNKERHTFPGAEHGMSYVTDTERYCRIVTEFINKVLKTEVDANEILSCNTDM